MTNKNGKTIYLRAVTMMDPATGWIEICMVPSTRADLVSYIVKLSWLTWYPFRNKVIVNCENECLMELKTMIQAEYGIEVKPTTTRDTQANSMFERVHQTKGNIIRKFKVQDMVLGD